MNSPVLVCHSLSKAYIDGASKIEVLKDMNLTVNAGEMVAIVGTSGSGKSTFLHLLGGLDKPTGGRVELSGKDLQTLSEAEKCALRNQYLGFVYQFHHLLPEFSALENVGMPLLIGGEEPQIIRERATALLEQVGLQDRMSHRLGQLSGGERQRVAIARALVANPLCVLADEPTGNLDPGNAERVLELFFNLQKARQTSVVMVTHDPNIAKRAQRTLRIEQGSLVEI
ncbi:MAG: lipoprotein-releasing ABC transporter ATP-binding protein LolD [Gammaproteobacteria bacterium]